MFAMKPTLKKKLFCKIGYFEVKISFATEASLEKIIICNIGEKVIICNVSYLEKIIVCNIGYLEKNYHLQYRLPWKRNYCLQNKLP